MIETLTMISDWNVEDVTAKYLSNPAKIKFRDFKFIREIQQQADSDLA